MEQQSHTQSGNVAFIILLAVALFAALSFAITQNRDSNTSLMTDQQAEMAAQEITAYGNAIANTVQKLKLRGCTETQYNFGNSVWTYGDGAILISNTHNPSAPATGCSVFVTSDVNLTPVVFPLSYTTGASTSPTSTASGHGRIMKLAIPGVGVTANDEIVYSTMRLNQNVCKKINEILGVTTASDSMPTFTWTASSYNGTLGSTPMTDTSTGSILTGKTAFCAWNTTNNLHAFLQVLVAR